MLPAQEMAQEMGIDCWFDPWYRARMNARLTMKCPANQKDSEQEGLLAAVAAIPEIGRSPRNGGASTRTSMKKSTPSKSNRPMLPRTHEFGQELLWGMVSS